MVETVDSEVEEVDPSLLRTYEIALFQLNPGTATSYSVPKDAELWKIVTVDNDAYAVFVIRGMTDEEIERKEQSDTYFERIGRNNAGG